GRLRRLGDPGARRARGAGGGAAARVLRADRRPVPLVRPARRLRRGAGGGRHPVHRRGAADPARRGGRGGRRPGRVGALPGERAGTAAVPGRGAAGGL
ncbi:MAG: Putative monooxygenase, partial [uncultured Corynebacteriales bacterium]